MIFQVTEAWPSCQMSYQILSLWTGTWQYQGHTEQSLPMLMRLTNDRIP